MALIGLLEALVLFSSDPSALQAPGAMLQVTCVTSGEPLPSSPAFWTRRLSQQRGERCGQRRRPMPISLQAW